MDGQLGGRPLLDREEFSLLTHLWHAYFPDEPEGSPREGDKRLFLTGTFRDFFLGANAPSRAQAPSRRPPRERDSLAAGPALLEGVSLETCSIVRFDYGELVETVPFEDFGAQLQDKPLVLIPCLGLALCLVRQRLFCPGQPTSGAPRIAVRLDNARPITEIVDLKSNVVGKFVTMVGNVVRVSGISALVLRAKFKCARCGCEQLRQFVDGKHNPPRSCTGANCKARKFELMRESATTVDFQKIKVQEIDNDNSEAGRIPRTIEVELTEDLVDLCIPGDVVTVSGVVKSVNAEFASGRVNKRARTSGLYLSYLEANSLINTRLEGQRGGAGASKASAAAQFTEFEKKAIETVYNDPNPFELLVASLCPSIFGHELVKAGLILALLGGTHREGDITTRSDVHVLVVGDPGLGKSQMLQAASQASPRSVYVCGNTTSTSGLTVTMSKEGTGGEVGLEAGALVLSDQGVCCIDEFDKMGCDPHALLEAMEQQQISIAKAGVVASLSSRCSILAAANPQGGHYNRAKTAAENLKMSAALLSRFDLVFILLDRPDRDHDQLLSEHIMRMHALAGQPGGGGGAVGGPGRHGGLGNGTGSGAPHTPGQGGGGGSGLEEGRTLSQRLRAVGVQYKKDPLPMEMLRKYIAYARANCHPTLTVGAAKVLQGLYLTMRREARDGRSMPITMRQLESLVRLAQARAKAELREEVTKQDAKDVVDMMQESLLEAHMNDAGAMDFGRSGSSSLPKQVKAFVAQLTRVAERKGTALFPQKELVDLANNMCLAVPDFDGFVDVLRQECYLLKKGPRLFQLQTSNYSQRSVPSSQPRGPFY